MLAFPTAAGFFILSSSVTQPEGGVGDLLLPFTRSAARKGRRAATG